jgi:signal peptidase II
MAVSETAFIRNKVHAMDKYQKLVIIAAGVVALDQATKYLIQKTILPMHTVKVIPGFFNLTHVSNPGGAFGFAADQSAFVRAILFLFISALALVFIFYFYRKTPASYRMLTTGFALVFGGAIGNLIDRIRFGTVVDFLHFYFRGLSYPSFNVADIAIVMGMLIFVYHLLFNKMPS